MLNLKDISGATEQYPSIIHHFTMLVSQQTVFLWHSNTKVMNVSGQVFAPSRESS